MLRKEVIDHPPADLADGIGQLNALGSCVHRQQLEIIAAYDEKEHWKDDGATSMAAWLAGSLGLAYETAAEWVRVAHAFAELPAIADAYADSWISWDQVRAVTRFATPSTDAHLAHEARKHSAAQLRRMARRQRAISPDEAADVHRERSFRIRWDHERHVALLSGRLPEADAAVLAKALDEVISSASPDPLVGAREGLYHQLRADALVEMASTRLGATSDAHRSTVVVHVDADVLAGSKGNGELEAGGAISSETARRLACDARWLVVADGPNGRPIGIGRASRQVPPWLMRELRRRDFGCRFPGCGRRGWVSAHHLVHWVNGGPTDMDNLVLLCGAHHRFVHEEGGRISGDPTGELVFIRRNGTVIPQGPPPLRQELRERFFGEDAPEARPPPESVPA